MVADILFFIGGIIAILALLDLFLGASQKAWLSLAVTVLWDWLDAIARFDYLEWLLGKTFIHLYFKGLGFLVLLFISSFLTLNPMVYLWFALAAVAWLIPVILSVIAGFGSLVLKLVELVVRRIAEYPKGPLLGVSTLLGSIATVLKVFVVS